MALHNLNNFLISINLHKNLKLIYILDSKTNLIVIKTLSFEK
jgi:hypothetical protein